MTILATHLALALLLLSCAQFGAASPTCNPDKAKWNGKGWRTKGSNCYPRNPFNYCPVSPNDHTYDGQSHFCFTTENAPCCDPSLALLSDKTCRHVVSTKADAWERLDCEYAVMTVKKNCKKKWLLMPHNDCDDWAKEMGDWLAKELDLNVWKFQKCKGYMLRADEGYNCSAKVKDPNVPWTSYSFCNAAHLSWTYPIKPNFGLNVPSVVKLHQDPENKFLWIHTYTTDYELWNHPPNKTQPAYLCVGGDNTDKAYNSKFKRTKQLLEATFNKSPRAKFPVKVLDSMRISGFPNILKDVPCSGVAPHPSGDVFWESHSAIYDWALKAAQAGDVHVAAAMRKAAAISLE